MSQSLAEWGNVNTALMPYLRTRYQVPGSRLIRVAPTPPYDVADGPEFDPIPEHDLRNHGAGIWLKVPRLPASTDPFGITTREVFPLFSRHGIAGGDVTTHVAWLQGTGAGFPVLLYGVIRTVGQAISSLIAGTLPLSINQWLFAGFSYVVDTGGPKIYFGFQNTPMVEATYFSQSDSSSFGPVGFVDPGVSAEGLYVDRWGAGPFLLGAYTLPAPVNGPGQQYDAYGTPNFRFFTIKGLMAHATLWNGQLTLAQWERLRTTPPGSRMSLASQGFPSLIADWWLDAGLQDRSGHGHDLIGINTQYSADSPYNEIGSAGNAPSGAPGGVVGYPGVTGPR